MLRAGGSTDSGQIRSFSALCLPHVGRTLDVGANKTSSEDSACCIPVSSPRKYENMSSSDASALAPLDPALEQAMIRVYQAVEANEKNILSHPCIRGLREILMTLENNGVRKTDLGIVYLIYSCKVTESHLLQEASNNINTLPESVESDGANIADEHDALPRQVSLLTTQWNST